jgi:hypothetical protein
MPKQRPCRYAFAQGVVFDKWWNETSHHSESGL